MHPRNRLMMVPLVLGVGFGKLPAQAQASTNKTTMEVVENFSVPSEIQTQADASYERIMTVLGKTSYENDEQLNNTILQVIGVLSQGANYIIQDTPQEMRDGLVDAYYKAISYKLYKNLELNLLYIRSGLESDDFKSVIRGQGEVLSTFYNSSPEDLKKLDIDRGNLEKLFKDADPDILKLMKLEIKDALLKLGDTNTFDPWSTNNVRQVDNLIRESYEIKQLLNEQIERVEGYDARKSISLRNLLVGFVSGSITTRLLLNFKSLVNLADSWSNKGPKQKTQPHPEQPSDGESTLSEELQQHHQEMSVWAEQQEDKKYTQAYECAMNLFNTGVAREAIYKGQKEIQVTGVTLKNGDDMYARRWDPVQIPAQLAHEWHEGDWNGGSAEDYKSQLKYNGYFFGTPRETPLFYKHTIDNKSDKLGRLLDVDVIQKGYTLPVLEMKDPDDSSTFSCDDLTIAKHFLPAELHKEKYIGFFLGVLARQPLWKWYLHPGELQLHEDKTYKTLQVKSGPRPCLCTNTLNQGRGAGVNDFHNMAFHPCRSGRSSISTHR